MAEKGKKLTRIQSKRLKEYVECGGDVRKMPGFKNENSAGAAMSCLLNSPTTQQIFRDALEELGYTEKSLAANLIELAGAEKNFLATYQGKIVSEKKIPDNAIRVAALNLIGKFIGLGHKPGSVKMVREVETFDMKKTPDSELDKIIQEGKAVTAEYGNAGCE